MAVMDPLTDILNDNPATAVPVQNNFQVLETYINGPELLRADGTVVMTGNLDLDGNSVVNNAAGGGVLGYETQTAGLSLAESTTTDIPGLSITFTAQADHIYRYSLGVVFATPNATNVRISLSLGGVSAGQFRPATSLSGTTPPVAVFKTGISGSTTVKAQMTTDSVATGSTTTVLNGGAETMFVVEDLGVAP